jgi:hypothetical protein
MRIDPMQMAIEAVANADVKNSKLRKLIAALTGDDPFLPDYSRRRDEATACYFCGGKDGEHLEDCPWVEARALLGK